jgi:Putative beta-lactamase-inhibitor-like, PepSY-like
MRIRNRFFYHIKFFIIMNVSIKNLLKVATLVGILFTVACTKESSGDVLADGSLTTVDELVVSGTGAGGPDSLGHHRDSTSGHFWKGGGGKHGNHPSKVQGDSIGFSGLPAAAQANLIANTDTSKITRIVKITLADGTFNYVVRFSDRKHIHYDAAGVVLVKATKDHQFTEITFADLPAAAQTYLNANTTVANITTVVKITKPDGTIIYGIRMSDNTHFAFDSAGALLDTPTGGGRRKGKH